MKDKKIDLGRRKILEIGLYSAVLLYTGCSSLPKHADPGFRRPVKVDFYGLLHTESAEANAVTLQKIKNALEAGSRDQPYDLITLELVYPPEKLETVLDAGNKFLSQIKAIAQKRPGLSGGLENTIRLYNTKLSSIRQNLAVYGWAKEHDVRAASIDPRHINVHLNENTVVITSDPLDVFQILLFDLQNKTTGDLIISENEIPESLNEEYINSLITAENYQLSFNTNRFTKEFDREMKKDIGQIRYLLSKDMEMAEFMLDEIIINDATHVAHFGGAGHLILYPETNSLYRIIKEYAKCTRQLLFTPTIVEEDIVETSAYRNKNMRK